jgi:hypothetical protein
MKERLWRHFVEFIVLGRKIHVGCGIYWNLMEAAGNFRH